MNNCGTCKHWWPNTPKGVVAEAKRNQRQKCLKWPYDSVPLTGRGSGSCRNFEGFKPFFMVPWHNKTWIKVEADSRDEMLEKVGAIAHKIAGDLTEAILKEPG